MYIKKKKDYLLPKLIISMGLLYAITFLIFSLVPLDKNPAAIMFFTTNFIILISVYYLSDRWNEGTGFLLYICAELMLLNAAIDIWRWQSLNEGSTETYLRIFLWLAGAAAAYVTGKRLIKYQPTLDESPLRDMEALYPSLRGFADFHEKNLAQELERYEEQRLGIVNFRNRICLAGPPCAMLIQFLLITSPVFFFLQFTVVPILTVLVISRMDKPYKKFKQEVSDQVVVAIGSFLELKHEKNSKNLNLKPFLDLRLLPPFDISHSPYAFSGSYQGINFKKTLLTLEKKKSDSAGYYQIFHGLCIEIDFPQKFSSVITMNYDIGKLGNAFQALFTSQQRVNLVHEKFENKFEVFADDQVEARAVLTPDVMEAFSLFCEHFGKRPIVHAAFGDSKLCLTVNVTDNNILDLNTLDLPISNPAHVRHFAEQIAMIHKIIELMNLRLKTRQA